MSSSFAESNTIAKPASSLIFAISVIYLGRMSISPLILSRLSGLNIRRRAKQAVSKVRMMTTTSTRRKRRKKNKEKGKKKTTKQQEEANTEITKKKKKPRKAVSQTTIEIPNFDLNADLSVIVKFKHAYERYLIALYLILDLGTFGYCLEKHMNSSMFGQLARLQPTQSYRAWVLSFSPLPPILSSCSSSSLTCSSFCEWSAQQPSKERRAIRPLVDHIFILFDTG